MVTPAQAEARVDRELRKAATATRPPEHVSAAQEFALAARICTQGRAAVVNMFQEARMGKTVDTASAQQLVEDIYLGTPASDFRGHTHTLIIGFRHTHTHFSFH